MKIFKHFSSHNQTETIELKEELTLNKKNIKKLSKEKRLELLAEARNSISEDKVKNRKAILKRALAIIAIVLLSLLIIGGLYLMISEIFVR
ncbi:Hypothetical protein MBVG_0510 [Mycoplasmopsis bovigenitalium 51080]|uniref:Uncharacterized protein n=1 Tax=Mycoplasmopsis bovigenitalium 51080 TaxID=1188235 RepID=N9V4E3_9BACT|nr:hypothetical protein [Mycoplasmopsis bovigenitalium]ENY70182.1 Hypothetical protein MBVG_0510 [Mycoplasmopsis bovigenitalium 51080]